MHMVGFGVCALATVAVLPLLWRLVTLVPGHLHGVISPSVREREFGPEYYVELALALSAAMLALLVGSLMGLWMCWRRGRYVAATIWLGLLIVIAMVGVGYV